MSSEIGVVGYARVSTEEQARDGVSLSAQLAKIEGYCRLHALRLVGVVVDAGESAKDLDRPGIQKVLGLLERGEAQGVLIVALDRITRSVADWNMLIDRYFSERAGKVLMSVQEHIDTRTAAGRMLLNILVTVAQWQREYIVERTSQALHHKMAQRERVGTVPFGYRLDADGVHLLMDHEEQDVLSEIARLDHAGYSCRSIAELLTGARRPTKSGGKTWSASTVHQLVRRLRRGGRGRVAAAADSQ